MGKRKKKQCKNRKIYTCWAYAINDLYILRKSKPFQCVGRLLVCWLFGVVIIFPTFLRF